MIVRQLIEELNRISNEHGDDEVRLEGCDCTGSLKGVEVHEVFQRNRTDRPWKVYLTRTDR